MPILIHLIVGELQLVEGHYLLHPVGADGRGVGMHMDSGRGDGIRFPGHHPAGALGRYILL